MLVGGPNPARSRPPSPWWITATILDPAGGLPGRDQGSTGGFQRRRHAVHAAITPTRILSHQAQHEPSDRGDRSWAPRPPGPAGFPVASAHQIAVPSQDRVWADNQLQPAQQGAGQRLQERREEGPVRGGKPGPGWTELPLQDRELMTQGQDFSVLVPVAHRQQPKRGECVGHGEIGQTQQHNRPSCPRLRREHSTRFDAGPTASLPSLHMRLTCTDEVFGRGNVAHPHPRAGPRRHQIARAARSRCLS